MIGDFQRPPEVFERATGNSNRTKEIDDQILNQQWDEPLHMQPPMIPTAAPTPQTQYTTTNTLTRKVEVPAERQPHPHFCEEWNIVGNFRNNLVRERVQYHPDSECETC